MKDIIKDICDSVVSKIHSKEINSLTNEISILSSSNAKQSSHKKGLFAKAGKEESHQYNIEIEDEDEGICDWQSITTVTNNYESIPDYYNTNYLNHHDSICKNINIEKIEEQHKKTRRLVSHNSTDAIFTSPNTNPMTNLNSLQKEKQLIKKLNDVLKDDFLKATKNSTPYSIKNILQQNKSANGRRAFSSFNSFYLTSPTVIATNLRTSLKQLLESYYKKDDFLSNVQKLYTEVSQSSRDKYYG